MDIYIYTNDRKEVIKLPIVPSEVMIQSPQKNESFETVQLGDLRTIGLKGLKTLSLSSFFPSQKYNFNRDNTHSGMEYVEILEKWRDTRKPLILLVTGINFQMKMAIDDFQYGGKDGSGDIEYSMTITEYKEVTIKTIIPKINFNIAMKANLQHIGIVTSNGVNSCYIGTTGESRRLEMFSMTIDNGLDFTYFVHEQNIGDIEESAEGTNIGTIGQSRRIEGIQINVKSIPFGYKLQYRCHIQHLYWTNWTNSGKYCGTRGKSLRVEAIEVRVIRS